MVDRRDLNQREDDTTDTPGGRPQEDVEGRPGVSKVEPEDYPNPGTMPPD